MGISIVVCCYNSEKRLPETIRQLSLLNFESADWELIIVDNNSKDSTFDVATNLVNQFYTLKDKSKVIKEPKSGLNNARIKGIKESKYGYICFCDDDNWLNREYLKKSYNFLQSNPSVGILGGKAEAAHSVKLPNWFEKYKLFYAVGAQNLRSGDLTESIKCWVYGAGMIIKKEVSELILEHSFITSDRNGKSLSSGGDLEICYLAIINGFKIWYDENLLLKHYISEDRLTLSYLKRMIITGAKASYLLDPLYFKAKQRNIRFYHKSWICVLLKELFHIKNIIAYNDIGFWFSTKIYLIKIGRIIKMNFKYDLSIKSC